MTPHQLAVELLNNACPAQVFADDFREYVIDVHCVEYTVVARPRRGIYQMNPDNVPTDWDIRSIEVKDI